MSEQMISKENVTLITEANQIVPLSDARFSSLDNPVWHALKTVHSGFAVGGERTLRYPVDVLPFLGLENDEQDLLVKAASFFKDGEEAFVKDPSVEIPHPWVILNPISCQQMVYTGETPIRLPYGSDVTKLRQCEAVELFDLVNFVQPGIFRPHTPRLGDYYGIRRSGKLVAVAGERLKINGLTEISAVCTHPAHTGKGYAQQLLRVLCAKIMAEGKVPFLHVVSSNTRAIGIYERFGFRRRIYFPLLKLKYRSQK